jgi:hypothetical protein
MSHIPALNEGERRAWAVLSPGTNAQTSPKFSRKVAMHKRKGKRGQQGKKKIPLSLRGEVEDLLFVEKKQGIHPDGGRSPESGAEGMVGCCGGLCHLGSSLVGSFSMKEAVLIASKDRRRVKRRITVQTLRRG